MAAHHGAKGMMGFSGAALWLFPALLKASQQSSARMDRGGVCAHDNVSEGLTLQMGTACLFPRQPGWAPGEQSWP